MQASLRIPKGYGVSPVRGQGGDVRAKHRRRTRRGITTDVDKELRDRKWNNKIAEWEKLWLILFPDDKDKDIPSPGPSLEQPHKQFDELVTNATNNT